jgi:hypothetical protein
MDVTGRAEIGHTEGASLPLSQANGFPISFFGTNVLAVTSSQKNTDLAIFTAAKPLPPAFNFFPEQ